MRRSLRVAAWIAGLLLVSIYIWPAWNIVSEQFERWRRARREAEQHAEWAAQARLRPPDVRIPKDYPQLEAILDSTRHVDVFRLDLMGRTTSADSAPNGMRIASRVPVDYGTWWPRFRKSFLSGPLSALRETPDTSVSSPVLVRSQGVKGSAAIVLVPVRGMSRIEIFWSDSLGDRALKRYAPGILVGKGDSAIQRLRIGLAD